MKTQAGFTLVEVLVATFITAVLAAMGTALMSDMLRARDQLQTVTSDIQDLELARAILKSDLAQIVPRRARGPYGVPETDAFVGTPIGARDTLMAFVRTGRDLPGLETRSSNLEFVTYLVRDGALIRQTRQSVDAAPGAAMTERVLLTGLRDVDVRFLVGERWQGVWDSRSAAVAAGLRAPRAIEVRFRHAQYGEMQFRLMTGAGL